MIRRLLRRIMQHFTSTPVAASLAAAEVYEDLEKRPHCPPGQWGFLVPGA